MRSQDFKMHGIGRVATKPDYHNRGIVREIMIKMFREMYENGFFVPNQYNRYSFPKTDVKREPDGSWVIKLSTEEQPGNLIPLGDKGGYFRIILRCYNPNPSMIEHSESANLPIIIREE